MITCQALDGFTDKLCDITREMPGMQRAKEATDLLHLIETVPQRFLMQWRAAAVADLHYLEGKSLRSIADELGLSFQAVSFWLRDHGPTHYLTVLLERQGDVEHATLRLITVDGENTKTKVKKYRAAGRKIVPAVLNLVDPDAPGGPAVVDGVDAGALWEKLG